MIGEGHSPEHVSLYCAERKILIAGDQILPAISTNVSTWHVEPEFDAVGAFLKTCKTFLDTLDPDTLMLPSHRKPFRNVHHRLRQLAWHHADRLNMMLEAAGAETSAGELIDVLFTPGLDGHQIGFAMGEAIAHLNHLVALGIHGAGRDPGAGALPAHRRRATGASNRSSRDARRVRRSSAQDSV